VPSKRRFRDFSDEGHARSPIGIVGAVSGVVLPFLVNPDQGNLGGRVAFIYGGILAFSCIGIWWYYPETKGRTFAEIDALFELGVSREILGGMSLRRECSKGLVRIQVNKPETSSGDLLCNEWYRLFTLDQGFTAVLPCGI